MAGFVYLWYDRKHKRYYLGKHWGAIDDGYICSSAWMRRAYERRPQDFKRKILEHRSDKKELTEAERKWGSFIKESELGNRYYNLHVPGKDGHWTDNEQQKKTVAEKISRTLKARTEAPEARARRLAACRSEQNRARISKTMTGRKQSLEHASAMKNRIWITDGISSRRVKPHEIPNGWRRGRAAVQNG